MFTATRFCSAAFIALLLTSAAGAVTIVVNDSSDALHDSGGCADTGMGACTLRDAITFANANTGADEIDFTIPGTGVQTITLSSDLPVITDSVTIDGYTQPGTSPNTNGPGLEDNAVLSIEIDGNGKACLAFQGIDATVRGLAINRCPDSEISFDTDGGGLHVEGNFIGTDPGCSATEYCPGLDVTRGQMAKVLANAFPQKF